MPPLERNLDALRPWTPAAAALLAAAAIPADFEKVPGTDGTLTFRRCTESPRRIHWLGGTSMPASSAAPLIESLSVGSGNGLGLSIGTGYEWAAFAHKLSPAQALFVYEPDPALARMALTLCDLSAILSQGKLILLCGPPDAAGDQLSTFLAHNIGFDPPAVLHPLPTIADGARNALLSAGEAIVRRGVLERQAQVHALAQQVDGITSSLRDAAVAFALTPRYAGERLLLPFAGPAAETLFVDQHASAGIGARLRAIAQHRPRTIVSDLFRARIGCVPAAIAVETWIPPLVGAAFWDSVPPPAAFATHDRIIVHGGAQVERLLERGIPRPLIDLRLLPRIGGHRPPPALALRSRVAMIADLPSIAPDALGIELPTHRAVFAAAGDLIRDDFLAVHVNAAPDILRRAILRAGVAPDAAAGDPALREPMLRMIRDVLIPALPLLTLARQLMAQHVPLRLIGDWQGVDIPEGASVIVQPFAASPGSTQWDDVAVLAHLSPSGAVSPLLWEALEAGVVVAAPEHAADQEAGSITTLLKPGAEYAAPPARQFIATIKSLLRDGARRSQFAAAANDALAT